MFEVGTVVEVQRGHGAGKFFAVVGFAEDGLLLADGRRRLMHCPKRKSKKHVQVVGTVLSAKALSSDKQLRNALHPFNF